jgi:hypothetical protein
VAAAGGSGEFARQQGFSPESQALFALAGGVAAPLAYEGVKAADAAGDELAVIGFLFGQYRNVFTSLIAPGITKASDAILGAIAENSAAINAFITGAAAFAAGSYPAAILRWKSFACGLMNIP